MKKKKKIKIYDRIKIEKRLINDIESVKFTELFFYVLSKNNTSPARLFCKKMISRKNLSIDFLVDEYLNLLNKVISKISAVECLTELSLHVLKDDKKRIDFFAEREKDDKKRIDFFAEREIDLFRFFHTKENGHKKIDILNKKFYTYKYFLSFLNDIGVNNTNYTDFEKSIFNCKMPQMPQSIFIDEENGQSVNI